MRVGNRADGPTPPSEEGAGEARQDAGRFSPILDHVRQRVNTELNLRKERASEVLEDLAGTVRQVAEPLREGPLASLAGYTAEAASRLGDVAADMRERDVSELADEVRAIARSRPAAFVAAGFAAGLLAARFLKSTAGDRPATGAAGARHRPATAPRVERQNK